MVRRNSVEDQIRKGAVPLRGLTRKGEPYDLTQTPGMFPSLKRAAWLVFAAALGSVIVWFGMLALG